jgi:hypothetical protein
MAISKLLIGLVVGGGLLALTAGKSSAAELDRKKTPEDRLADFQAELAEAVAAKDAEKIRAIAQRMEAAGLHTQAAIAIAYAQELYASTHGGRAPGGAATPRAKTDPYQPRAETDPYQPRETPSPTPLPTPLPPDVKRSKMTALQTHLRNTRRYKEDRIMVKGVQLGEGLGADGMYGAALATAMGDRYGLIPPVPFYWSKKTWRADKEKYKAFLTEQARKDPAREAEWLNAIRGVDKS